ncbi:hypothetical protein [Aquimarina algicola]|uniref:Uncharacterized protein n=1 Tax=Aquimarina algicola TaxID=2589995 RepID=A0A504J891_9FLAO|nr:hypothetical protein [Aquimarina algicola]TPN84742.1 hypothetical protein FHK87_17595 [Aquimarina algicola]
MKIMAIFISLMLFSPLFTVSIKSIEQDTPTKYYINNVRVTKKKFDKKLVKMVDIKDWFCVDTNIGGITGYNCRDKSGQEYIYKCITESKNNKCILNKIRVDISKPMIKNIN